MWNNHSATYLSLAMNLLKPHVGLCSPCWVVPASPSAAVDTHTHFHTCRRDTEGRVGHSVSLSPAPSLYRKQELMLSFGAHSPLPNLLHGIHRGCHTWRPSLKPPAPPPSHPRMQESDLSTSCHRRTAPGGCPKVLPQTPLPWPCLAILYYCTHPPETAFLDCVLWSL